MLDMNHPKNDLVDRMPIWGAMQTFWMDTDPGYFLKNIAELCAKSKYSIEELQLIYWNEVRPAVSFNMRAGAAPQWAGFDTNFLTDRILKKHKYGKRLPTPYFHQYSNLWWKKLKIEIEKATR